MKTNTSDVSKRAKELVARAKKNKLVASHTVAFKIFPVEEEIHKGKVEKSKK